MIEYHDLEWGVPLHDDIKLFEFLTLEGAQAGLNWLTILKKRPGYRVAFDNFDIEKIARYDDKKIEKLLVDSGIIRNRLKINSTIRNAAATLRIQQEFGSLDAYIWQFASEKLNHTTRETMNEIPSVTPESKVMSNDLVKRGFKFVGPTICYAFMQAIGMVNDHTVECFRYKELLTVEGQLTVRKEGF